MIADEENEDLVFTLEERKYLKNLALLLAFDKLRSFNGIKAHLNAAIECCQKYQEAHSTFANDEEILRIKTKINQLYNSIELYSGKIYSAVTGVTPGAFDYVDGNDIFRLRVKEAVSRGITTPNDDDDYFLDDKIHELIDEDPIDLYLRLK